MDSPNARNTRLVVEQVRMPNASTRGARVVTLLELRVIRGPAAATESTVGCERPVVERAQNVAALGRTAMEIRTAAPIVTRVATATVVRERQSVATVDAVAMDRHVPTVSVVTRTTYAVAPTGRKRVVRDLDNAAVFSEPLNVA